MMMKKVLLLVVVLLMLPLAGRADTSTSRVDANQFPLVMFAVPDTDAAFAQVKAMGIDYVHIYGIAAGTVSEGLYKRNQAYLDMAQKHGLKVMFDLDGSRRVPAKQLEEMQKVVHHFKDHPALGFWYLSDEPNLHKDSSPADLLPFYKMIKQETPDIPVCVCMSVSSKKPGLDYMWSDFGEDYDILSFDTYPVRGEKFPDARLNRVTDFTTKTIALGKPVMPAVQIINPLSIDYYVKQAETAKQSTADWRYPNLQELRYWNFASLLQGARGMMYYSYKRSEQTDATWMDRVLKPATLELRQFTDLVQPAYQKDVLETGAEKNLFFARWKRGEHQYIAIVNGAKLARKITDATVLQRFNSGKLTPWNFTRTDALHVDNDKITSVDLLPWEVAVWEVQ